MFMQLITDYIRHVYQIQQYCAQELSESSSYVCYLVELQASASASSSHSGTSQMQFFNSHCHVHGLGFAPSSLTLSGAIHHFNSTKIFFGLNSIFRPQERQFISLPMNIPMINFLHARTKLFTNCQSRWELANCNIKTVVAHLHGHWPPSHSI